MLGDSARHVDLILNAKHVFDRDRDEPRRCRRQKPGDILEADPMIARYRCKRIAKRDA